MTQSDTSDSPRPCGKVVMWWDGEYEGECELLDKAGRQGAAQRLRDLPGDLAVEGVRRAIRDAQGEAWAARDEARRRLTEKIRAELARRGVAAAAAAAAAVAGSWSPRYWAVRNAVYEAVYAKAEEAVKPLNDELLPSVLQLLDRMLPDGPLIDPVVDHADVICGLAEAV